MFRRVLAMVALGVVVVVNSSAAGADPAITYVEIPPFAPAHYLDARDINDAGVAVGQATTDAGPIQAFRRLPDGTTEDLGRLPGGQMSMALAVNERGAIVGASGVPGGLHPILWTEAGGMVDLGVPAGENESRATDINESGWIVGYHRALGGAWVRDPATGVMRDIGTLPGADEMTASAIADDGTVIGFASVDFESVPFRWTAAGGLQAMAPPPGRASFSPMAINASGQIVGDSYDRVTSTMTSWLLDPSGDYIELPFAGYAAIAVRGVTDDGVAVGWVANGQDQLPVVWDTTRGTAALLPLPFVGASYGWTYAINDRGVAVVGAVEVDVSSRSFLGQLVVPPGPPTDVAFAACSGDLTLSWAPPEFDGYGAVRYRVYSGGNVLTETTATSYTDRRLAGGEINVLAFNEAGESLPSNQILAAACRPDPAPPVPPAPPVVVEPRFTG